MLRSVEVPLCVAGRSPMMDLQACHAIVLKWTVTVNSYGPYW
jgi:hypothetical protein